MTVAELVSRLTELKERGFGDWPVLIIEEDRGPCVVDAAFAVTDPGDDPGRAVLIGHDYDRGFYTVVEAP